MKRKRRNVLRASPEPPIRLKHLTLDLHEALHRAIKKNAAEEGVTMAEKLRALLSEHYRSSRKALWATALPAWQTISLVCLVA
jgi:hypothetical protein